MTNQVEGNKGRPKDSLLLIMVESFMGTLWAISLTSSHRSLRDLGCFENSVLPASVLCWGHTHHFLEASGYVL